MTDDGWQGPIEIDGKQYLHKSGAPTRVGDPWLHEGRVATFTGGNGELPIRVLLKPVEPDPPSHPAPDQFIDPNITKGLVLGQLNADAIRRQLESEQRAVELLREWASDGDRIPPVVDAFLRARDEGLPWPEGQ